MNHQITLYELGIIPGQGSSNEDKTDRPKERSKYAFFCGGCICQHCANNVECDDHCTGEPDFGCFNCDDCKGGYKGDGPDNWKDGCWSYKVTDAYAKVERKKFRALRPAGMEKEEQHEEIHQPTIGI